MQALACTKRRPTACTTGKVPMNIKKIAGGFILAVAVLGIGADAQAPQKDKPKEKPSAPTPVQKVLDKNKELIPALIASLQDPDAEIRQRSAHALLSLGKDAVPPLIAALQSKDRELRANAAYLLASFGQLAQDALPPLVEAMKDPDLEVRRRVIYAIDRIIDDVATPIVPPPFPMPPAPPAPMEGRAPAQGQGVPAEFASRVAPPRQASLLLSTPPDPGLIVPQRRPVN
jgi:hypothetical protein